MGLACRYFVCTSGRTGDPGCCSGSRGLACWGWSVRRTADRGQAVSQAVGFMCSTAEAVDASGCLPRSSFLYRVLGRIGRQLNMHCFWSRHLQLLIPKQPTIFMVVCWGGLLGGVICPDMRASMNMPCRQLTGGNIHATWLFGTSNCTCSSPVLCGRKPQNGLCPGVVQAFNEAAALTL